MSCGYLVVAAPVPQAQKRRELQKVVDESRRRDINSNYRSKLSRKLPRFVALLSLLSWKAFFIESLIGKPNLVKRILQEYWQQLPPEYLCKKRGKYFQAGIGWNETPEYLF